LSLYNKTWSKSLVLKLMLSLVFAKKVTVTATTNPHWGRMVGYGPFSLFIHSKNFLVNKDNIAIKCNLILVFK
jgi:hypothetical protein